MMENSFQNAITNFELPFQHHLALNHCTHLDRRIEVVFQWISAEAILQPCWVLDGHLDYVFMQQRFNSICEKYDFPHFNAI